MYFMNNSGVEELKKYKIKEVGKIIGITEGNLSRIIRNKCGCQKRTAYCITKFLNSDKEIQDYFIYQER